MQSPLSQDSEGYLRRIFSIVVDSILTEQYVHVHTVAKGGSAVLPQVSLPISTLNISVSPCVRSVLNL